MSNARGGFSLVCLPKLESKRKRPNRDRRDKPWWTGTYLLQYMSPNDKYKKALDKGDYL